MTGYGAFSDDFYVNMNLSTEMEFPRARETLLHDFEQVRRRYPKMQNFYSRDTGEFVLEEEKSEGAYRWVSTEQKRINSGAVNPDSYESALEQHRSVLELIPYEMSVTTLDCEALSVMLGFDFSYRGNQNEILAEAIGLPRGLERFFRFLTASCCPTSPQSSSHWMRIVELSAASALNRVPMPIRFKPEISQKTKSAFT